MISNLKIALVLAIILMLCISTKDIAQVPDNSFTWKADDENLKWLNVPEFMPESCLSLGIEGISFFLDLKFLNI